MSQVALPDRLQQWVPILEQHLEAQRRVPVSTYRLQLNPNFTFSQAQSLVPYLHDLGITDCYASPFLHARKGSVHGYDVINPQSLNPQVGTPTSFQSWAHTLQQNEMGLLMDIVPNHMAIFGGKNDWWRDVLKHGIASTYSRFFDINWEPRLPALRNKVLIPILGRPYGETLLDQELQLVYAQGQLEVTYYEHRFPIDPGTVAGIFEACRSELKNTSDANRTRLAEFQHIIAQLKSLPLRTETEPELMIRRHEEATTATHRISVLHDSWPEFRLVLDAVLESYNGVKGNRISFNHLHCLLEHQAYRLSYWRTASDTLNYRRFFDIVHLAGVRVEDPIVFDATHALILTLLQQGNITGLRVDHPDGLLDPSAYFEQLQQAYVVSHCQRLLDGEASLPEGYSTIDAELLAAHYLESHAPPSPNSFDPSLYVIIEKILETDESLPEHWAINGTVGYDFLNQLNGVFIDQRHAKALTDIYMNFTGDNSSFDEILYASKKLILQTSLASEVEALVDQLTHIVELDPVWRDCTRNAIMSALLEIIACFPVYRTYLGRDDKALSAVDLAVAQSALAQAQEHHPTIRPEIWAMLQSILTLCAPTNSSDELKRALHRFILSFQQVTGPVMAKGLEDTTFYRYTPLASLNEVGGNPHQFGISVDTFHNYNLKRLQHWPTSLLTTSTHDTKRSEDVRARLNVLSELPERWRTCLYKWRDCNQRYRTRIAGQSIPHPQEEYLLYQTLLGAWPTAPLDQINMELFKQRIRDYMHKALREAKRHTTWVNPNEAYEEAVDGFIDAVLDPVGHGDFLTDFLRFQHDIAEYGIWNSLSQTLLKLTAPGVPDIYQGCETWDFSLVDPDNRRPVDYTALQSQLNQLNQQLQHADLSRSEWLSDLIDCRHDGRIKLFLTWQTLTFRRAHAKLFLKGSYIPLEITGTKRDHLCAFARLHDQQSVIVLAPRLPTRLISEGDSAPLGQSVWQDTQVILAEGLPHSVWSHILTTEKIEAKKQNGQAALSVADAMSSFPVAMLSASIF